MPARSADWLSGGNAARKLMIERIESAIKALPAKPKANFGWYFYKFCKQLIWSEEWIDQSSGRSLRRQSTQNWTSWRGWRLR